MSLLLLRSVYNQVGTSLVYDSFDDELILKSNSYTSE